MDVDALEQIDAESRKGNKFVSRYKATKSLSDRYGCKRKLQSGRSWKSERAAAIEAALEKQNAPQQAPIPQAPFAVTPYSPPVPCHRPDEMACNLPNLTRLNPKMLVVSAFLTANGIT